MERIDLQHLKPLAFAAYDGISIYPHKKAEAVVKEYTTEINADIKRIRQSAGRGLDKESINEIISNYARRYESHLKTWLESGRAQYVYFREWRRRSLNAIAKHIQRRLNNIKQVAEKIKVGIRKQRRLSTGGKNLHRCL